MRMARATKKPPINTKSVEFMYMGATLPVLVMPNRGKATRGRRATIPRGATSNIHHRAMVKATTAMDHLALSGSSEWKRKLTKRAMAPRRRKAFFIVMVKTPYESNVLWSVTIPLFWPRTQGKVTIFGPHVDSMSQKSAWAILTQAAPLDAY